MWKRRTGTHRGRRRYKDGALRRKCRTCENLRIRARKCGLDLDSLIESLESTAQCEICGTEEPGGKWGVLSLDHDHETGEFRGVLCAHCNMALGHVKDSPAILRAMIEYLELHAH